MGIECTSGVHITLHPNRQLLDPMASLVFIVNFEQVNAGRDIKALCKIITLSKIKDGAFRGKVVNIFVEF